MIISEEAMAIGFVCSAFMLWLLPFLLTIGIVFLQLRLLGLCQNSALPRNFTLF